jgi:hypothetical protein
MKIVIRNGYQYFELYEGVYALVLDDDGEPKEAPASLKEWQETEEEFILMPKAAKKGKAH